MAMPVSSMLALNKIPADKGDWIVVYAANGAVGKSIAQIAKARGINVASIVNREAAKKQLEDIGVEHVIVAGREGWIGDAKNAIDGKVVGGVEMVGGQAAQDMLTLLDHGATMLTFGAMSNEPMTLASSEIIFKEIVIRGFWGLMEFPRTSAEEMSDILSDLTEMLSTGQLQLPVHQTYDLDQISNAGEDYYKPRDGKLMIAA